MAKPQHPHFAALIDQAKALPVLPTSVVAPEEENSLSGALLGRSEGLIEPILIGCQKKITAAAEALGQDIAGIPLMDEPDHKKAAALAVSLVHEGRAGSVMKGHLHTGHFLGAIVKRESGLRTKRKLTHVFAVDVPGYERLLMITDSAVNITPDLATKVDITQNAIDLARSLGIETPKVALLTALARVNEDIQSTTDAAIIAKMADRGQISGGLVDGPFAMDNAVNLAAAKTKGIESPVAGQADVLVMPSMQAGNILTKALTFLAGAQTGGLLMGAQVPVILTSRADDGPARLASCALAVLYANGFPG